MEKLFNGDLLYNQGWGWLAITSCFENQPLLTSQVGVSLIQLDTPTWGVRRGLWFSPSVCYPVPGCMRGAEPRRCGRCVVLTSVWDLLCAMASWSTRAHSPSCWRSPRTSRITVGIAFWHRQSSQGTAGGEIERRMNYCSVFETHASWVLMINDWP